jgi:hypothetical protein
MADFACVITIILMSWVTMLRMATWQALNWYANSEK